jgi:ubiquinone/menaquinone biosynthesis C-methylase UbiE
MKASFVDPKRLVADGYDQIAETYAAWTARSQDDPRERYTALLLERLPPGARFLDLGCGSGVPSTKRLAERFDVTGVDGSAKQIALARRHVPEATFLQGDMTALDFPPESFDAVTAFYSITHVPREEHGPLLRAIAGWLRPGGLLVATMGAGDSPGAVEADWLGAPMYFSHYDGETNRRLVAETDLTLLSARQETTDEDGVPVTFLWVVAQKRTPS